MKKQFTLIGFAFIALAVGSCASGGSEFAIDGAKNQIVVIGDKVPLRETPTKEGKWISALNIGEVMEFLDQAVDASDKDQTTFSIV